jgi:sugar phosphate isomerase/epimerase
MQTTRRQWIAASMLLAAGRRLRAADPSMHFPTAPRERLAIASYSLRSLLPSRRRNATNPPEAKMDIKEMPAYIVKRYNIRNLELLGQHLASTEPAYLDEYRQALSAAGVRIINIPTNVNASFYDPDAAKRTTAVENSKKWIDTAVALGSPSVRLHIQGAGAAPQDAGLAAETLTAVAQYGASKNVMVTLENDDPKTEDAFFIIQVVDQVKSPWVRALPDFCNSMLKGDEKVNYDAVTAMFQRAYNISHVKDAEIDGGKVFHVDLARTFTIAKEAAYKGYFSIEFEGEGDPVEGVQKLVDASIRLM